MMWCGDPLLHALKQYGYNVVRLPRADIRPLQVVTRRGSDLDRLGDLATIFQEGPPLPPITQGVAASISGGVARTGQISASAGIPILGNVVAAMGGSPVGLQATYAPARSMDFAFLDVQEESIEVARLDQFLARAKVHPDSRQAAKLLDADAVYVITSTLKSAKINVAAKTSDDQALGLDAGGLARLVGGNGKVNVSSTDGSSSTIQYAGPEPLTFGFQAVRLMFEKGQFDGFRVLPPGTAAIRAVEPGGCTAPPCEARAEESPMHMLIGGADAPFAQFRDEKGARSAVRRGLLIGINVYPALPPHNQLRGCVRDVELMRATLRDTFGFAEENLTVLTDLQATRDAILAAIDDLIERTGPEDAVFLQYSGHGSQVVDAEGDEPDGWDETIVPSDSGRGDVPNRDITDDEIYERLLALSLKTSNITLLFDCCHSGTISRDRFGAASRRIEPDPRPRAPSPIAREFASALRAMHARRDIGGSGLLPLSGSYVLIAGCRDEETSFEHVAADGDQEVAHGALTYFFHQELVKAAPGATVRDVFDQASPRVSAIYRSQHPQLEGSADRVLFGAEVRAPGPFVAVKGITGREITLAAGAAHGLAARSVWTVFGPGAKVADPALALVRATISRVGGVTSVAILDDGFDPATIPPGAKAAEEAHDYGDLRFSVQIVDLAGADDDGAIAGLVAASRILRLAADEADARVYLSPAIDGPTWTIVGRDGQPLAPPGSIGDEASRRRLVDHLEAIARHRNVRNLANADPADALKGKVDLILLRNDGRGSWSPAEPDRDGRVVFRDGERIALRILNKSTKPIYATVLDLGLTYRISQVYPVENSKPAQLVSSLDFGLRPGEEIELEMPEGYALPSGEEVFKLFATTEPSDFGWLTQGAVRGTAGHAKSPLDLLMNQALATGTRDANVRRVPASASWTTVDRAFMLVARDG
jgi:Caspase domain